MDVNFDSGDEYTSSAYIGELNSSITSVTEADTDYWDPWNPPNAVRVDRTYYSLLAIYMAFLFFFSFILNTLVLVTVYKNKSIRTPLNYIIINLTVSDLVGVVSSNSVTLMANIAGRFFMGKWMCVMEGYVASVAGIVGEMSMAVMAFERYFVVCKPLGQVSFTAKHATMGVIFTWVYSVLWNSPPMIFWNGYDAEGIGTNCAPNYFDESPLVRWFIILYFVFCFIIPFAVIFLSYGKLIHTLVQMNKVSSVASSGNARADREVTKMVVMMVSAYCFCWTPYAVVSLYNVLSVEKNYIIGALPAMFAKSATVYNPLIYIGMNRQFRDCVIKLIFNGRNPWKEDDELNSVSGKSNVTTVNKSSV